MSRGIIVAGFGAIGKTTLGNKYDNIIDMESGYYQWDNTGFEDIPYEQRKGKKERPKNKNWPDNYHKAILKATEKYDSLAEKTKDYFYAIKLAPQRVADFFKSLFDKEKQDELERQRVEQEKLEAERKAREEAREKERLEKQKLKNSPEYKKRRASYER